MNGISPLTGQILWSYVDVDAVLYGVAALVGIAVIGAVLARIARLPKPSRA